MNKNEDIIENDEPFDFCGSTDVYYDGPKAADKVVVLEAIEHGYRSIVVPPTKLSAISEMVAKMRPDDCKVKVIVTVDFPCGNLSSDVRAYSIFSAKEKGANGVEVNAPASLIKDRSYLEINKDLQCILSAAKKSNLEFRYVIDQSSKDIDDPFRIKICKILNNLKVPGITLASSGLDNSEAILRMRKFKAKLVGNIKCVLNTSDPAVFGLYPTAGADIIGIDWKNARYTLHAYNSAVQNEINS